MLLKENYSLMFPDVDIICLHYAYMEGGANGKSKFHDRAGSGFQMPRR